MRKKKVKKGYLKKFKKKEKMEGKKNQISKECLDGFVLLSGRLKFNMFYEVVGQ